MRYTNNMRKKVKVKYKNIFSMLLVVIIIIVLLNVSFSKKDPIEINDAFVGMMEEDVLKLCEEQSLECEFNYEYNSEILEKIVISQEKEDNKYNILVSKGQLTSEVLASKKVNELGKVPIMMYHGIVDTEETKYIGGNVDKDGYNRTAKAFREDLEFYYQNGYRMIRLMDYVNGDINTELGLSPIILTFDDGLQNNFNVLGKDANGNLEIDPNCAVGILEEFKKKYNDFNVTATFFLMSNLFNQKTYNEEIMKWLVEHGYDIGNHTLNHQDFTKSSIKKTQEVVGGMYQKLTSILGDKYVPIVALPYGSPYKKTHDNYPYIMWLL